MNSDYPFPPYVWLILASAILHTTLALYAWRHRTVPGAISFAVLELFTTLFTLFTAGGTVATTPADMILCYKLEAISNAPTAVTVLYFALDYTTLNKRLTLRQLLLLAILPILTLVATATNDIHHLFWTRIWVTEFVQIERGLVGNILTLGIVLYPLSALWVTGRYFLQSYRPYRIQAFLLLIAMILAPSSFLLEQAGINRIGFFDPVFLASNIIGVLCAIAIYRFGMLGIVPIGRDTAIERMAGGMMILNTQHQIVDLNPAAQQLLGVSRTAIGQLASQVLANHSALFQLVDAETIASTEITIERETELRYFQVYVSSLSDSRGFHLGHLFLFHDNTEQKQIHAQLLEQQRVLATLEEREHLARELHDTLVQATASIRMQAETADMLLTRGETETVHAHLARVADTAQDMHLDLREYLFATPSNSTQEDFFDALRAYSKQFTQRWSIQIELHVSPEFEQQGLGDRTEIQLTRIIQEALVNVRKYASAHYVQIRFERVESQVQMVVQDDGRGFDLQALATKETGGFGTRAMRERAQLIGGSFEIQSAPGKGTRVIIAFPWEKQDAGLTR